MGGGGREWGGGVVNGERSGRRSWQKGEMGGDRGVGKGRGKELESLGEGGSGLRGWAP